MPIKINGKPSRLYRTGRWCMKNTEKAQVRDNDEWSPLYSGIVKRELLLKNGKIAAEER